MQRALILLKHNYHFLRGYIVFYDGGNSGAKYMQ